MKKSIYLAALAALTLTACSSDGDGVFDQSAAERLEQYKKEYADVLTAEGGLWTMEYFSNPDEPGYVFVMKFDKNGSVEISANHKWIGNEFKQETSLWKMIADNGPVLSFNSYNNLFHIFSDPADITGSNAPTGENGEINETGYGHEGDYEFQVMEVADDGQTVRLLGKKRMYDIFLHRLDPSTNVRSYLDESVKAGNFLSPYFGYVNVIAPDGEEFVMYNLETGIPSVYPKRGDEITQTRSGNGIFTLSGFRFMRELEVPRPVIPHEEEKDPVVWSSFEFQEDGSLLASDGTLIVGPYAIDVFLKKTTKYSWSIDLESCEGDFAAKIQTLVDGIKAAYPTRSLENVYFSHEVYNGELWPSINVKISGAKEATFYLSYSSASKDGILFSVAGMNSQASIFEKKTKALTDFAQSMSGITYLVSSYDVMSPESLELVDKNVPANKLTVKVN